MRGRKYKEKNGRSQLVTVAAELTGRSPFWYQATRYWARVRYGQDAPADVPGMVSKRLQRQFRLRLPRMEGAKFQQFKLTTLNPLANGSLMHLSLCQRAVFFRHWQFKWVDANSAVKIGIHSR